MDLIRYSDHYFARYAAPVDVEVDALLVSLAHSASGTDVRLRAVEPAPVEARDAAMASDIVAGNAGWFPDNGMSDADVRALLSPTLGVGNAMVATVRIADAVTVFRDGRTLDFGDVRLTGAHVRVRARLANIGVRIYPDHARGVWELRWLNLTPLRMIAQDADLDDADPPEEVCVTCESELKVRAGAAQERARARAERMCADAADLVDAVEALAEVRGTAEWRARVEELTSAMEEEDDD